MSVSVSRAALLSLALAVAMVACGDSDIDEPSPAVSRAQAEVVDTTTAVADTATAVPTPASPSTGVLWEILSAVDAAGSLDAGLLSYRKVGMGIVLGDFGFPTLLHCLEYPSDPVTRQFQPQRSRSTAPELWPFPYADLDDVASQLCNTLATAESRDLSKDQFLDFIDASGLPELLSDVYRALPDHSLTELREAITERE